MKRIIRIKPYIFLLVSIGLIPFSFFTVWSIRQIIGTDGIELSLLLFFGGFFGFFLFWLYTISYGLELLNTDSDMPNNLKKNKTLMVVLLFAFIFRILFSLPFTYSTDSRFVVGLNIILGLIGFFALIYLLYNITEDYIYHAKDRMPRLIDYFIVLFHFAFFPIGLILMHSHVRIMLKDKGMLKVNKNYRQQ